MSSFLLLFSLHIFVFSQLDYDDTVQGQHAVIISVFDNLGLLSPLKSLQNFVCNAINQR